MAAFLDIPADGALLDAVCRVSSFEFMAAAENRHHYDDHYLKSFIYPVMGIESGKTQEVIKVRANGGGRVGSRRAIPRALAARLEAKWQAVLSSPTGCADYEALCESVRRQRKL